MIPGDATLGTMPLASLEGDIIDATLRDPGTIVSSEAAPRSADTETTPRLVSAGGSDRTSE